MQSARLDTPTLVACALLAAAAFVAFVRSLDGAFIFDDFTMLRYACWQVDRVDQVIGVAADGVCRYRPVRYLSLALDHIVWGRDPRGYHLTNVALHALATPLVFLAARRVFRLGGGSGGADFAAVAAAVIWAVHPVQADSVAYISGRRDLLVTLFYLAAFVALPERPRGKGALTRLLLSGAFFVLAMGSKEMAVTFPVVALGYWGYVSLGREELDWARLRTLVPLVVVVALVAAVSAALLLFNADRTGAIQVSPIGGSWATHALSLPVILLKYLQIVLFPVGLWGDYEAYPMALGAADPRVWLGLFVVVSLVVAIVLALRARWLDVSFGITWFAVTMLPVSQLVPHHERLAEHYLYLPTVGAAVVLAGLLSRLLTHRTSVVAVVVLTVGLTVATQVRIDDYATRESFATSVLRHAPGAPRATVLLSDALQESGRFTEALAAVTRAESALEVAGRVGSVEWAKLGVERAQILAQLDQLEEATAAAEAVLEHFPAQPETLAILGTLLVRTGDTERGVAMLERAVSMRGYVLENRVNLGVALAQVGRLDEADEQLARAVELAPADAAVRTQWAEIAYRRRDAADAIERFLAVVALDASNFTAHARLAELFARVGDETRSRHHEQAARRAQGTP